MMASQVIFSVLFFIVLYKLVPLKLAEHPFRTLGSRLLKARSFSTSWMV